MKRHGAVSRIAPRSRKGERRRRTICERSGVCADVEGGERERDDQGSAPRCWLGRPAADGAAGGRQGVVRSDHPDQSGGVRRDKTRCCSRRRRSVNRGSGNDSAPWKTRGGAPTPPWRTRWTIVPTSPSTATEGRRRRRGAQDRTDGHSGSDDQHDRVCTDDCLDRFASDAREPASPTCASTIDSDGCWSAQVAVGRRAAVLRLGGLSHRAGPYSFRHCVGGVGVPFASNSLAVGDRGSGTRTCRPAQR